MTWAALRQRLEAAHRTGNDELIADVADALGLGADDPDRLLLFTRIMTAYPHFKRLAPQARWATWIGPKGPRARVNDVEVGSKAGAGAALLAATFANLEGAPA